MSTSRTRGRFHEEEDDSAIQPGTRQPRGITATQQDEPEIVPDTTTTTPRMPEPGAVAIKGPPSRSKHGTRLKNSGDTDELKVSAKKELKISAKKAAPAATNQQVVAEDRDQAKKLAYAPGVAAAAPAAASAAVVTTGRSGKALALAPPIPQQQTGVPAADSGAFAAGSVPRTSLRATVTPGAISVPGIDGAVSGDLHEEYDTSPAPAASPMGAAADIPVAQSVTEAPSQPDDNFLNQFPVAESFQRGPIGWIKRHKIWAAAAIVLVVGCIVGGVIGGILSGGGGGEAEFPSAAPSQVPTSSPTITDFGVVEEILTELTPRAVLLDESTPQHAAMRWLLDEGVEDLLDNPTRLRQRYTAVTLYYATDGPNWTHQLGFLTDTDECNWNEFDAALDSRFGVVCGDQGQTTALQLSTNNLRGTIPDELTGFPLLSFLSMGLNQLSGTIPSGITELTNLESIRFFDNSLVGTIPQNIGLLNRVTWLALQNNQLSSSIPSSIGQISPLGLLTLYGNRLTGTLPPSLGRLDQITEFLLNTNLLDGTVPSELVGMTSLRTIRLEENGLTGSLEPLCLASTNIDTFQSDCLTVDVPGLPLSPAEVECSCCTVCCSQSNNACLPNNFTFNP